MNRLCGYCGMDCGLNKTIQIDRNTQYCLNCWDKMYAIDQEYKQKWNKIEINKYFEYFDYAQRTYRPIFKEDVNINGFHVDYTNGLFYFGYAELNDKTLILSKENIVFMDIQDITSYNYYEGYDEYTKIDIKSFTPTTEDVNKKTRGQVVDRIIVMYLREPEIKFFHSWYCMTENMSDWGLDLKLNAFQIKNIMKIESFFWTLLHNNSSTEEKNIEGISDYSRTVSDMLAENELIDAYQLTKYNRRFKEQVANMRNYNVENLRNFSV